MLIILFLGWLHNIYPKTTDKNEMNIYSNGLLMCTVH